MNPSMLTPRTTARRSRSLLRTAATRLAAALALAGLASTAHAQATWVGDTSQDWNNAANWSSDPNPPTGNFIINNAVAGVFPIVSTTPTFTPNDIIIANAAGLVGRLDQTGGTLGTGTPNWFYVATERGTGTFNMSGGNFSAQEVHVARSGFGAPATTGTINLSGDAYLSTRGAFVIADGQNDVANIIGTVNVGGNATIQSEGDLLVAFAGAASTVGTLNIETGGTVNVATATKRWMIVTTWDSTNGFVNINGGTLNLNADTDLRFSTGNWGPGASNGTSAVTINAGAINGGAAAVIDLNNNADRTTVSNTLNLNGGTVNISAIISTKAVGTRVINFNGGTLRPTAAGTFIGANAASAANVKAGGARFDTNGFDITVARALVADATSPGGGLTKTGLGTLTLTGANTYTGNTTVSEGSLVLADNATLRIAIGANGVSTKITGAGSVTLNGDLDFDLSAADASVGNSWTVVDHATLTETYGSTFSVIGFALQGTKWIKPAAGTTVYEFDPATGVLRTIVDPTITFPPPVVTASPSLTSYPLGTDITLRVTATGTGNLTYQWYYQANAGATPVAISGAQSATYTLPNATAAADGIYSVIVSDDANGSTPTTVSFPAFNVLPGAAFAVAHYRFEEGPALATIVNTQDSIGSSHLTALGTPNYADDALPYSIIPATGAANSLGVNFPPSGNHGLIAPTTGTLAEEPFVDFTIEAFVRLDSLAGWQTIVGRDDDGDPGLASGGGALVYLSKSNSNNGFRIEIITKDGVNLQINSTFVPAINNWYHLAAVGNATTGTLTLYVNGTSVGTATGYNGLFVPPAGSNTAWTLGRGQWANNPVDFLRGDLDEVRFSRAALPPSQFLNSANGIAVVNPSVSVSPGSQTVGTGTNVVLTATGTSNMGGTVTYQWYKDGTLLSGQNAATYTVNTASTAGSGTYRVVVSDNTPGYAVTADASTTVRVISMPSAGRRSIGLNFVGAGSGNWSSQVATFASDYIAGVYPAANWNNSATVTGVSTQTTPLTLAESSGASGFTTATWASAGTWAGRIELGTLEQKSSFGRLVHGYIESRASSGSTVSLANVPYGTYDVYVYLSGGTGSGTTVGSISLDRAETPTYYYTSLQHDNTRPAATPTVEAPYSPLPMISEATEIAAATPANFVRFTGVTGSDLVITSKDAVLNANAGGIAAVQIIDTTPVGVAYPPLVTSAPAHRLAKSGANVTLGVTAVAGNAGGTLSYAWSKGGSPIGGANTATLTLNNVTTAANGSYTVTVTETSSLGIVSVTRTADVVVVAAGSPVLINADFNAGASTTFTGHAILRADGTSDFADFGGGDTLWNGLSTGAGASTQKLARTATGLSTPLTVTYTGAEGGEDNTVTDVISDSPALHLMRDYLWTDNQTTPLNLSIGGLQNFAGHEVTLLVYAYGKLSTSQEEALTNDTATVTLAAANNHLGTAAQATSTYLSGFLSSNAGRRVDINNLIYTAANPGVSGQPTAAYVTYTGVVAADGTVAWSLGADADAGRIAINGFQLLLTANNLGPVAPVVTATGGSGQVSLSWNAVANATSYTIRRGTVSGAYETISSGAVTGTSYVDTNVVAGTTYYYVVSGANGIIPGSPSAEVSAAVANNISALEQWRADKFGANAGQPSAANDADPDGDGRSNLLEYALGTEPLTADSGAPVTLGRSGNVLTLSFSHVADATLVYSIQASDTLGSWTTVQTYPAFTTAGTQVYTDTVNVSTAQRRFLRLNVTVAAD